MASFFCTLRSKTTRLRRILFPMTGPVQSIPQQIDVELILVDEAEATNVIANRKMHFVFPQSTLCSVRIRSTLGRSTGLMECSRKPLARRSRRNPGHNNPPRSRNGLMIVSTIQAALIAHQAPSVLSDVITVGDCRQRCA